MTKRFLGVAMGVAVVVGAASAGAQSSGGRVITLRDPITIVGRIQRPLVTIEVARTQPKITLTEIRQPFVDRIAQAVARDPY